MPQDTESAKLSAPYGLLPPYCLLNNVPRGFNLPYCLTWFACFVLLRALCALRLYVVSYLTCFKSVWIYLHLSALFTILNLKYWYSSYIADTFYHYSLTSLAIVVSSLSCFNLIIGATGWITSFQMKKKLLVFKIFWKYFWRNLSSKTFP